MSNSLKNSCNIPIENTCWDFWKKNFGEFLRNVLKKCMDKNTFQKGESKEKLLLESFQEFLQESSFLKKKIQKNFGKCCKHP